LSLQDHAARATAVVTALQFEDVARYTAPADAEPRVRDWSAAKRGLDLGIAIPLLLLLAPMLAAIALWVWLDSPGPALFCQRRLGLQGRPFQIFKFRTMTVLEDGDHIVQAHRNDARVTRAGAFLRKTSLDELPQLINVIRGEMSLVGPRPHALAHDRLYATVIRNYQQRQQVKPGITGWAQVNGFRGETPTVEAMKRRVEHDVWYANNRSIALDFQILLRTARVVLGQRNAY
jgi:putative colanic acid biosynthesis UDP-glucose lipid carrier transferase